MKYKKGLVSCIMPTYNRADFLEQRFTELEGSSYKEWELIVVDDGSTDNTEEVVKNLKGDSDNIHYVKVPKNSGCVSIPRAIGITFATGEYIAPWDDDVYHSTEKLEMLVSALSGTDSVLAYGDRYSKDQNNQVAYCTLKDWDPTGEPGWGVDGAQYIYRRSVYEDMDLVFCRRACDWHTAKEIWKVKPGFVHVKQPVSIYEWHGKNRSLDDSTKEKIIHPEHYKFYFEDSEYKCTLMMV